MEIHVRKLTDRDVVKRAMLTTQGKVPVTDSILSDETMEVQLFGKHSTLETYIFEVYIDGCTEREHTHIVRHEEIGKFVSTSRPDWSDGTCNNARKIRLFVPVSRMIDIMSQRLCGSAWYGTKRIFEEIRKQVFELDETVGKFLVPPCSKFGYCTEVRSCCGYVNSTRCKTDYEYFKARSIKLVEKFKTKGIC
jgi:hypothetical protein